MVTDEFDSSDATRSAKTLAYVEGVTFDEPFRTELGDVLPSITVAYETYGTLDQRKDNAVLICHALSGDSHVTRHGPDDDPGWWDVVVGPGKPIDTDAYFVVCANVLGGCRGTTGPGSINPETDSPYGPDFPTITAADIVAVQAMLLDHLGIDTLCAVVGGSMGGHQVLTWVISRPDRVRGAVALATSARLSAQSLAFDVVGRNAIVRDPNFRGGQYYDSSGPSVGLALARMLGHITYLSPEAMRTKFEADRLRPRDVSTEFEKRFSVGSYLAYQGDRFVERFDANSYMTLSLAMDLFDLGATPQELSETLEAARCRWLIVSFTGDWLFPPEQSQELVSALTALGKSVSYCSVQSSCGHDAFLLPDDLSSYGELIRAFLANVRGSPIAGDTAEGEEGKRSGPRVLHARRIDHDRLMELTPRGGSVLDLGCGSGSFLARLRDAGHERLVGVEIDERAVIAAVRRGLDVIHADLNKGLALFTDGQFDVVVLSQTLQAIRDAERTVAEMLRVGRLCLVSFPNFGYFKLREMLAREGRAPLSSGLLRYEWHDSPNIRFFTLLDFEEFCSARGIRIHRRIALDTESDRTIPEGEDANLLADMAIYVLGGDG